MTTSKEIFIGRQPVFDHALNVYGYELLFRSGQSIQANVIDGDAATMNVIVNAFTEIGLSDLIGEGRAFINVTRNFLLQQPALPFAEDKIYLEILEDVLCDQQVISRTRELNKQGFHIALDDFVYSDDMRPLLDLADIVKLDIQAMAWADIEQLLPRLRQHNCMLLAEKVETQEELDRCKSLGFDYFQGYFLSRPNIVKGTALAANRLAILQLLAQIQQPDCDFDELAKIIANDPGLGYKLLRNINSAYFGLSRTIESIQHAAVLMGLNKLKNWITLISLSSIEDKPQELIVLAITRASMAEHLAHKLGCNDKDMYFTVGMFSMLDAMMDAPMAELIKPLPLADDIQQALIDRSGTLGDMINLVEAYEQGQWEKVSHPALSGADIRDAYLQAATLADEAIAQMS
jgi:EAL and modified HD-GYP domain-containing signal transduction protein